MSGPAGDCDLQAAAELCRALAHPMRVRILCRLLDGEISVAGLESELGLKQPSLSQQLGQLRDAGVVTTRRVAKSVYYSLSDQRVRLLVNALRAAVNGIPPSSAGPAVTAPPPAAWRPPAPSRAGSAECGVFAVVGPSAYD